MFTSVMSDLHEMPHAMRRLAVHTKQLVEPSSAVALAAVLGEPARFAGLRVGLVLSGGNVDPDRLPWLA